MRVSNVRLSTAAVAWVMGAVAPGLRAGLLSGFQFNSDASSQISSDKFYTAKADPGSDAAGPAVVNGVVFDAGTLTGTGASTVYSAPGVTYSIQPGGVGPLSLNAGNQFDVPAAATSPGTNSLLTDMVYTANAGGQGNATTLTFTGLSASFPYSARIYYRVWDNAVPRPSTITFDEDGAGPLGSTLTSFDEDFGNVADGVAGVITYQYQAISDGAGGTLPLVVSFSADTANNSWHLYGMTNELTPISPEPATAGLLALVAGGGLLARRRRR